MSKTREILEIDEGYELEWNWLFFKIASVGPPV